MMSGPPRALLSVYDKTGIVELARGLTELGWVLISSGGTAGVLAEAGLDVIDVADHTGSPAMLGHRVVTLHPRVHGGILADRDDDAHRADLDSHGIDLIDLVVVNLYPFRADPGIEMIDVGGPTMVRGAAKNHAHVGVVVDPTEYEGVLRELATDGRLRSTTRRRLARAAFAHTAAYDSEIVTWLDREADGDDPLPQTLHLALERVEMLRYGENPHQAGARYRSVGSVSWWDDIEQLSGIALSYLNLLDAHAAWRLAHDLGSDPAVAIVKHANPCGVAVGPDLASAYNDAFACDPRSAFGGIVACSRPVDEATVLAMEQAAQADVIIAPAYEPGILDRLVAKRRNTRILQAPPSPPEPAIELRRVADGFLAQKAHHFATGPGDWTVVTRRQPSELERADAAFAWRVCGHVKSNAIVLAKDRVAWGIGAGQQNRLEAGEIAARKAAGRAAGGAGASDAFYPFADGIHAAADAGVSVIIQPGGSVNDEETVSAADARDVAMIFTGERHFLH